MEKISRSELIGKVADETGMSRRIVKTVLDQFAVQVTGHVKNGVAVEIHNLGKFYPKDSEARTMKSPLIGKEINVPAKRSLAFKASAVNKDLG